MPPSTQLGIVLAACAVGVTLGKAIEAVMSPFMHEIRARRRVLRRARRHRPARRVDVQLAPGTTLAGRTYLRPTVITVTESWADSLVLRGVAHRVEPAQPATGVESVKRLRGTGR